jgi:hypothetical protein
LQILKQSMAEMLATLHAAESSYQALRKKLP